MKTKKELQGCIQGLDMVHHVLWQMKKDAEKGSRIINIAEVDSIMRIVLAVMKDLDDGTFFKKGEL